MAITGIQPEEMSPEYANFKRVQELTKRFNRGDLDYLPKKDLEQIAMLAAQHGTDFKPKSKPVKKALFDFVDMAAFGLVPDRWRPKSLGEEYFGESGADKFAGGLGSVAGLFTGGALALKGARKGKDLWSTWRAGRGGAGGGGISAEGATGSKIAQLNPGRDTMLLGSGAKRIGPGPPTLLGMGNRAPITQGARETYNIYGRGGALPSSYAY